MDIISAYREIGSYRGAAEMCGTTHKAVRLTVEQAQPGEMDQAKPTDRPRNYYGRSHRRQGRLVVREDFGETVLPAAQAAGYAGSPRNFRRVVAEQKRLWRRAFQMRLKQS